MQTASMNQAGPFAGEYRHTTIGRYLFKHEYAFIRRSLGRVPRPDLLLDLGCGSGGLTLPLHDFGLAIVGADINPISLAAFQRISRNVPLVVADSRQLPFADATFDGVIAIQTLDFIDHHDFLRECSRVLRPDGLLVFDALNRHSYKWHLKNRIGRRKDHPSSNLDYRELLRATRDYGFDIQVVRGYNWVPFTRETDSELVNVAALVESALRLHRFFKFSPKILVAARRGPR